MERKSATFKDIKIYLKNRKIPNKMEVLGKKSLLPKTKFVKRLKRLKKIPRGNNFMTKI